ncbi:MAG: hypothetical protein K0Q90_1962 [Paenibacillaceae bacterium]|nr:hypothetical protein [Paenibacillaceae bacterium]
MAAYSGGQKGKSSGNGNGGNNKSGKNCKPGKDSLLPAGLPLSLGKLSPQQLAVITALLSNALKVDSVLVDRNKDLEIVLTGTLRRKTKTDKLLEELEDINIGDLLDAISNR